MRPWTSMHVQSLFCVIVPILLSGANAMFFNQAVLTPRNPKVCLSDNLVLTCNYTGTEPKPILMFADNVVNRSSWTQIDAKVATYVLSNVSEGDQYLNIRCCLGNCSVNLIGAAILNVYSQPIPLEDFHCEVYNYHNNMTCTWNFGQEYVGGLPDVFCQFRLPAVSSSWTPCPPIMAKNNGVTMVFDTTKIGDFSLKEIEFNVTVATKCGKQVSELYQLNTKNIVRPAPAYDLNSTVINSTCIEWSYKQHEFQHPKNYSLTVSSKWNDLKVITGISNTEKNHHTVCDLHPYTEYMLTVKLIPENDGFWSSPSSISATTLQSAPSSSPELIPGGYSWNPRDCVDSNFRNVFVYWQDIPEIHKNGEIHYFSVTLSATNGEEISERGVASSFRQKEFSGHRVRCDTYYTVTITAHTDMGPSPENYKISVAKFSTDLLQPAFWAEIVNGSEVMNGTQTVSIQWPQVSTEVKDKREVQKFTICYCRKDKGNCQDKVPLKCVYAPGTADWVSVAVEGFPEDYLYGVSMTTPLGDSGLMWQGCLYLQDAVPTKTPSDVTARTGAEDNTVIVVWSQLPCASGQPFIESYTIQYCPVTQSGRPCSGLIGEVSVPGTVSSYTIQDLDEDLTYSFRVWGVTPLGHQGPASEAAFAIARNDNLKPGQIAGIAIGGLFGLAFIFGGIFFVVRNCRQKMTSWKRQKQEVIVPDMPVTHGYFSDSEPSQQYENVSSRVAVEVKEVENEKKPGLERQVSKDSGVEDSPTSPGPRLLPDGYCRVAPILPTVAEVQGHMEIGSKVQKVAERHVGKGQVNGLDPGVTVFHVEMGPVYGMNKQDETEPKAIMQDERSDSGIGKSKPRLSDGETVAKSQTDSSGPKPDSGFNTTNYYRQSVSSGETDLKQPAINLGHMVYPPSAPNGDYIREPATESRKALVSGEHTQKRNKNNLKLNVDGSRGFQQSSDPSIPNADYVFATNEGTTPQYSMGITSESPQLANEMVKLQCIPMPNAFKTSAGQPPESLIQESDVFDLLLEHSISASHLSQSQSNADPVGSDYMKAGVGPPDVSAISDGYIMNGVHVNNEDNLHYNVRNTGNNKPVLTNYISTTDNIISNNQNEAARQRQSSGVSDASDSTDSGVNSDRANQGSQRSSMSDNGEEMNLPLIGPFQPDKLGYVLAVHMAATSTNQEQFDKTEVPS